MFHWRDDSEGLTRAFTSRRGGVSAAPYDSLNLGSRVGDDPADVTENRNRVASALGVPAVAFMNQCHGADVAVIEAVLVDIEAGQEFALAEGQQDFAKLIAAASDEPPQPMSKAAAAAESARGWWARIRFLLIFKRMVLSPVVSLRR